MNVYDDERCVLKVMCNLEKVCMRYLMQRRELKEISQTTKAEYSSQQRKNKLGTCNDKHRNNRKGSKELFNEVWRVN